MLKTTLKMTFVIVSLLYSFFSSAQAIASSRLAEPCTTGEHWVRSHHQSAYTRADGTAVSGSFHSAHCQKNPPAYAAWAPKLLSGMPNNWRRRSEKVKPWTEEEKERVLEALSSLPSDLLITSVDGIYRLENSTEYSENPAGGLSHQIVLYDPAFTSTQNLARVLAHELAHKLYSQFYDSDKGQGYANAADWISYSNVKTGINILIPNRDGFVEEDGKEGPDEDFSNNIEYYLFNGKTLKNKTPKVYDWIQKKYGDKFKIGQGN